MINIPIYILFQILIVKHYTSQSCDLLLIAKVTYTINCSIFKLVTYYTDCMVDIFLQINSYLNSLKLTSSKQNFLQVLIYLTRSKNCPVSDRDLINLTRLHRSVIYRKLEYFKSEGYIQIETVNKQRFIQVNLPNSLKQLFQDKTENCLLFFGKPVEEVITQYENKIIREIKFLDVYSVDGHILFKEYWILKEALIESEPGAAYFEAAPKVTQSRHFLLSPLSQGVYA